MDLSRGLEKPRPKRFPSEKIIWQTLTASQLGCPTEPCSAPSCPPPPQAAGRAGQYHSPPQRYPSHRNPNPTKLLASAWPWNSWLDKLKPGSWGNCWWDIPGAQKSSIASWHLALPCIKGTSKVKHWWPRQRQLVIGTRWMIALPVPWVPMWLFYKP